MPNHCENTLTVTGLQEDLHAFRDFAKTDEENPLDISKFVPMPDEINNTESPNPDAQLAAMLQEKYGAPDWNEWACDNWGTKWVPYEQMTTEASDGNSICYWFFTAWAPLSEDCMEAISARFPTLNMHLEYSEPGMGFQGYYKLVGGQVLESQHTEMEEEND